MDLKALKEKTANLDVEREEFKKTQATNSINDARFWSSKMGKDKTSFSIIRFLPGAFVDGADAPKYVRLYKHSFQGPLSGLYYIENCRSTLNEKDPCNELTRILYKNYETNEHDKKLASLYKRKTRYIANIMVIQDEANPENNGKIFLFEFGVKILKKIEGAMFPKIGKPINAFDLWNGANFGLDIKMEDDWPNYDASKFDSPSAIAPTDEEIENIWKAEYSLKELIAPDQFKSYDDLKKKLDEVLSFTIEERGSAYTSSAMLAPVVTKTVTSGSIQPAVKTSTTDTSSMVVDSGSPVKKVVVEASPTIKATETPPWESTGDDALDEELKKIQAFANMD